MSFLLRLLAVIGVGAVLIVYGAERGPTITKAGKAVAMPEAAYQPAADKEHKVVFGLHQGSKKPAQINPALNAVARAVNLYGGAGVPLAKMKFVAVAYGDAADAFLDNDHYRQKFGVDNPNIPLIVELKDAGIVVAVCGQSLEAHAYQPEWVDSHVTVALSAITTITELQENGYVLMPL